ncbi:MAG: CHAT domain-containing protein [Moorea sp. SIO3G5]|nr:CHAT domain-containing protein [Moorena sp. SIO3G5]
MNLISSRHSKRRCVYPESAMSYHTYHIRVANRDRVQVEKWDAQNQSLGRPSGALRRLDEFPEQVKALLKSAQNDELNDSGKVRVLGEALFDVLFDDVLRQDFVDFYNRVVHQDDRLLRVELEIDAQSLPDIAALPWEFICLPQRANSGTIWLATAPNLIFYRRSSQWQPPRSIQLEENEKLRIALVVSAPQDGSPVVYEKVQVALQKLAQKDRIELLPTVNPANPEAIDAILAKEPHIFHFIGHGRFKNEENREVGQLALVDDYGESMWVDADYFSELFNQHRPGIVLLQACEGGMLSESQAFVGLASMVVQQNIPVVLAMQYAVSNITASRFACRFYQQLAQTDPVDIAAQVGRRTIALNSTQYRKRDFATPVIFMGVRDGYLFQTVASRQNSTSESESPVLVEGIKELNHSDLETLADILKRSGRVSKVDSRRALCISIELDPSDIEFMENTSPRDFAMQLVFQLHNTQNFVVLCKLCQIIAPNVPGFKSELNSIKDKLNCD